jgi:hypothetical protein
LTIYCIKKYYNESYTDIKELKKKTKDTINNALLALNLLIDQAEEVLAEATAREFMAFEDERSRHSIYLAVLRSLPVHSSPQPFPLPLPLCSQSNPESKLRCKTANQGNRPQNQEHQLNIGKENGYTVLPPQIHCETMTLLTGSLLHDLLTHPPQ